MAFAHFSRGVELRHLLEKWMSGHCHLNPNQFMTLALLFLEILSFVTIATLIALPSLVDNFQEQIMRRGGILDMHPSLLEQWMSVAIVTSVPVPVHGP